MRRAKWDVLTEDGWMMVALATSAILAVAISI